MRVVPTVFRTLHVEAAEDGTVGGSHRSLTDLVSGLPEYGFAPTVLFYSTNPFVGLLEKAGIPVITWDAVRQVELEIRFTRGRAAVYLDEGRSVLRRRRLLRELQIDLLHLNNSPFVGYDDWLPAARSLGIPCVASMRGDVHQKPRRLAALAFRHFQRIVPVSHYVATSPACRVVPPSRVQVIYNGTDLSRFPDEEQAAELRSQLRRELGIPADHFLAVMAGTIRDWKGQLEVVRAVAMLPAPLRQRLQVLFAGGWGASDEPYVRLLRDRISTEALESTIHLVGRRPDIPALFAAADVALHASIQGEPFGLVVIEALACGAPVLAAGGGGPAEILREGGGLTHDPSNPAELAALLQRVITEPELLRRLSSEARPAAGRFSIQTTRSAMAELYRTLLGASPAQPDTTGD